MENRLKLKKEEFIRARVEEISNNWNILDKSIHVINVFKELKYHSDDITPLTIARFIFGTCPITVVKLALTEGKSSSVKTTKFKTTMEEDINTWYISLTKIRVKTIVPAYHLLFELLSAWIDLLKKTPTTEFLWYYQPKHLPHDDELNSSICDIVAVFIQFLSDFNTHYTAAINFMLLHWFNPHHSPLDDHTISLLYRNIPLPLNKHLIGEYYITHRRHFIDTINNLESNSNSPTQLTSILYEYVSGVQTIMFRGCTSPVVILDGNELLFLTKETPIQPPYEDPSLLTPVMSRITNTDTRSILLISSFFVANPKPGSVIVVLRGSDLHFILSHETAVDADTITKIHRYFSHIITIMPDLRAKFNRPRSLLKKTTSVVGSPDMNSHHIAHSAFRRSRELMMILSNTSKTIDIAHATESYVFESEYIQHTPFYYALVSHFCIHQQVSKLKATHHVDIDLGDLSYTYNHDRAYTRCLLAQLNTK